MAFCIAERGYSDFFTSVEDAAIERRIPYTGALELTYRCNLNCCHCYCNLGANDNRRDDELSTKEIKRILGEAADAGCFWLLLTGGEVLLRKDFWDIYLYAVKKGMLAEVFTNATLIDDMMAERFAEFRPFGISISIYGSTPALHDKITRVKGSFEKMMDAFARLKKHKVGFSLKTILMNLNYADLKGMRELAASLGAEFHYDTVITPRTDGGMSPAKYRLSPAAMAADDLERDFEGCKEMFANFWNKGPDDAIACGAGIFSFNVNPYGDLSPCTQFKSFRYPLKDMPFHDVWKRMAVDREKGKKEMVPPECRSCSMLLICSNCPAWSELEANSPDKRVDYVCEYAKCLEKMFFKRREEEDGEKALSKTGDKRG